MLCIKEFHISHSFFKFHNSFFTCIFKKPYLKYTPSAIVNCSFSNFFTVLFQTRVKNDVFNIIHSFKYQMQRLKAPPTCQKRTKLNLKEHKFKFLFIFSACMANTHHTKPVFKKTRYWLTQIIICLPKTYKKIKENKQIND